MGHASNWGTSSSASVTGSTVSTITPGSALTDIPIFVASGASHKQGLVPDPGASAGTTKFLCEDATFKLVAFTALSGSASAAQMPAFSGDISTSAGATVTALSTTGVTAGTYGDGTHVAQFTVDAKGRISAASSVAISFPGGISGFANPTSLAGPTATNGSATTAMRSDAAPAIDMTVTYTWTAPHKWHVDGDPSGLGSPASDAVRAQYSTPATAGAQVTWSPRIRWTGSAWNSASSISVPVEWASEVVPVPNGTSTPDSYLRITKGTNASNYVDKLALFTSGGASFGTTTDPGSGVVNVGIGFRIANAATGGNYLRGNGTNFVSAALAAADLTGSVAAAQMPALTGDVITTAGTVATTLATTQAGAHTWSAVNTFSNGTDASSSSTGAVVLSAGGLGVALQIQAGSTITSTVAVTTTSGTTVALKGMITATPTADTTGQYLGAQCVAQTAGTHNFTAGGVGGICGFSCQPTHQSTGTLTRGVGVNATMNTSASSGGITDYMGYRAIVNNTSAATIASAYGYRVETFTNSGGGAITTLYGLKVENQTAGGTNYAIFTGTGIILHGDSVKTVAGNESTGAGSAALGANCPAVTLTAPYKWIKMLTSDGSTVYYPVYK